MQCILFKVIGQDELLMFIDSCIKNDKKQEA